MEDDEFNMESGMVQKPERVNQFGLRFEKENLDLVLRVFNYLIENENEIPVWEDHTLSPVDDLKELTKKLEAAERDGTGGATVDMNFKEWIAFSSYVEYSKNNFPNQEDRYSMEDVFDLNEDMENNGLVPF